MAVGTLAAPHAHAQPSADSAAAQALFEQGKSLLASGRAAEACPKLEESQRLDPGSGTLLNLARCYEETRRLASAWSKYLEAAAAARASDNADREREARQQAARLRPRLSNLVLAVPRELSSLPGLELTRDGESVGAPQWGLPIPTDAGEHTIVARADGYLPWKTVVMVRREGTTTTVNVRALEPEPDKVASAPVLAPAPAAPAPVMSNAALSTQPEARGGTQRAVSIAVGVVGLAGLGVGAGFALKSRSDHERAAKYCSAGTCNDPRGVSATRDAYNAGNVATVAAVIGGVGVATALTLWLTAPSARRESTTQLGLGFGTLELRRTF